MNGYAHAGAILRAFRKQVKLSQKAFVAKTQLFDTDEIGISESVLSQIEHGKRLLTAKYFNLIAATGVFSPEQMEQLYDQAIADMIQRQFGAVSYLRVERILVISKFDQ